VNITKARGLNSRTDKKENQYHHNYLAFGQSGEFKVLKLKESSLQTMKSSIITETTAPQAA
jgi:hypothetical protein